VRDIVEYYEKPTENPFFVWGTPEQVADRIEQIAEEADLDGFNLVQYLSPGTFEDFIELVVPELQRRGRYRTAYRDGETLRERLFDAGPFAPDAHPAGQARLSLPVPLRVE
jgi:hypothetical protein